MGRVRGVSGRSARVGIIALLVLGLGVGGASAERAGDRTNGRLHQVSDDYRQTVSEATTLGAVAGAIVGGAIGAAQGRGAGAAIGGAAIGALAGGLLGNLGGRAVADNKASYARREDGLDRAIAQARSGNRKLAELVSISGKLVSERRATLARLEQHPDDGERRRLASQLADEVSTLDSSISTARQQRDTLRSNASNLSGRDRAVLTGEADRANSGIATLQSRRDELERMRGGL